MRPSFARLTIVRLRYPTIDDHGADRPDVSAEAERLDVTRCWLEPTQSTEDADGRLAVSTGYTVDAPALADITAMDHVEYAGVEYDVVGEPQRIPSPTGALDSVRLTIQRWEG